MQVLCLSDIHWSCQPSGTVRLHEVSKTLRQSAVTKGRCACSCGTCQEPPACFERTWQQELAPGILHLHQLMADTDQSLPLHVRSRQQGSEDAGLNGQILKYRTWNENMQLDHRPMKVLQCILHDCHDWCQVLLSCNSIPSWALLPLPLAQSMRGSLSARPCPKSSVAPAEVK